MRRSTVLSLPLELVFPGSDLGSTREALLKWKAQYRRAPCTNHFRSDTFDNANIIYYFMKQATLMRRSTVLSLPL